jgi:outer membrane protein assembly factor BamB
VLVAFAIVACILGLLTLALTLYGVLGVFGGVLGLLLGAGLLVVAPLLGTKRFERWLERDAPLSWQTRAKVLGVVGALVLAGLVAGAWTPLRIGLTRLIADLRSTPAQVGADAGTDAGADAAKDGAADATADSATDAASPADAAEDAAPSPPEERAARWSVPRPYGWALGEGGSIAVLAARDHLSVLASDGKLQFDHTSTDLELDPKLAYDETRGLLGIAFSGKPATTSVVLFDAKNGDKRWSHVPARKRATRAFFGAPGEVLFFDDATLTALDETKGTVLWTAPLDLARKPGASLVTTADVLEGRTLLTLVSSDPRESSLRVLEGDGGVAWKLAQPGVLTTLAVAGGPFVLSSSSADGGSRLTARDPATGDVRFEQGVGDGGGLPAVGDVGAGGLSVSREGDVLVARDVQTGAAKLELPFPAGAAFLVSPRQPGVVVVTQTAGDTTIARYDETGARKSFVRAPFVGSPLAWCAAGVLLDVPRESELRFVPW